MSSSNVNRVALVTGSSTGGIGEALCLRLRQEGFRVFASARNVSNISASLIDAGCEPVTLDVTDPESVKAALQSISQATSGQLNLLINNAGIGAYPSPLLDLDLEKGLQLFQTNVFGVLRVIQAFAPLLIATANEMKQPATIVNISSILAVKAYPFRTIYSASKAAVTSISDGLRMELSKLNVNVVNVVTGGVRTSILAKSLVVQQQDTPNSAYSPTLMDQLAQIRASHDSTSVTAEEYAADVVPKVVRASPPSYIYAASYKFVFHYLVPILPTWLADYIFAKKMGVHLVQYRGKSD